MAFRKRNIAVGRSPASSTASISEDRARITSTAVSGVHPSPLTSHPVTSTGTPSLDGLMGGHAGFALGSSLLIEESGTTDFAGALLRYFAAEGICHGHVVHVVGVGEGWLRELPGVVEDKGRDKSATTRGDEDKMKIAWRYENLGQTSERGLMVSLATFDRNISSTASGDMQREVPFCHTFDLTKRLVIPTEAKIHHIPITNGPFDNITQTLSRNITNSPPNSIHRLIIPSILSPALYPPTACRPENFLSFLRTLRSLLRQHPTQLVAMLTLPLELHPRTSALTHWAELLSDAVLELVPFPHRLDTAPAQSSSRGKSGEDLQQPQGLVRVHRLPISTERGEGGAGANTSIGADLAFAVSRRKFAITAFSLPPVEGDQEAQRDAAATAAGGHVSSRDLEF